MGFNSAFKGLRNVVNEEAIARSWAAGPRKQTFTELGTFVPIFLKLFLQYYFHGSNNRLNCSQNGAFIQIFQFSFNYIE
jgi:hypothetical protein